MRRTLSVLSVFRIITPDFLSVSKHSFLYELKNLFLSYYQRGSTLNGNTTRISYKKMKTGHLSRIKNLLTTHSIAFITGWWGVRILWKRQELYARIFSDFFDGLSVYSVLRQFAESPFLLSTGCKAEPPTGRQWRRFGSSIYYLLITSNAVRRWPERVWFPHGFMPFGSCHLILRRLTPFQAVSLLIAALGGVNQQMRVISLVVHFNQLNIKISAHTGKVFA